MKAISLKYAHVCEKHFISGRSAKITDELHPDWVPSLHLGYNIAVKAKLLGRFERTIKRNKVKSDLLEIKPSNPPSTPILTVEEPGEETSPPKTRDICSQTEDFYIIEGVNYALMKKNISQADRIARLQKENAALKEKMHKKRTWDDLKCNNKRVQYFTAFANFETMEVVYKGFKFFCRIK